VGKKDLFPNQLSALTLPRTAHNFKQHFSHRVIGPGAAGAQGVIPQSRKYRDCGRVLRSQKRLSASS
jgi:hypothetical protein